MTPRVHTVSLSPTHSFSKLPQTSIHLLAGLGVEGDAHLGVKVQHLYHVRKDPRRPNRSQVHLIGIELFSEPTVAPLAIAPGNMGENITTEGVDLLGLPTGTRFHLGGEAVLEITGLRTPCVQMDRFRPGLMAAVFGRDPGGKPVPRAGVMAIVLSGGTVAAGDRIRIELPPEPHRRLERI